ncbi:hypothetical protein Tco_0232086 [Tanacetum coccineum]
MISPGSSRYSSNDMVHNHYLEEAKKQIREIGRNSKTSVMRSARSQSTTNGSKPKPRINNQKCRNWPASKTSYVTAKTVPIAEHSRISRKWVPTRKIFTSSTTKVDSDATNDSNEDITNQYDCEQTLDVSAEMTSDHNSSELKIHDHNNEPSSSKLIPKVVPSADKTTTSRQKITPQKLLRNQASGEIIKELLRRCKTKLKDNDKGSRSKITKHEGTSLQHNKDQRLKNSTTKQSQEVQGSKIQDLTSRIQRPHIKGDC